MSEQQALLESRFLQLRETHFPSLRGDGGPFIYLDSAATSLKPTPVLDTLYRFYRDEYSTVHRAIYRRAQTATELYDDVRLRVARFVHIEEPSEIIFTSGTTDSINIVADSIVHAGLLGKDSVILISEMEHHSNIVPWQMACERTGARLMAIPLVHDHLDLDFLEETLNRNAVPLVSISHCSNILGTVNPIEKIAEIVKRYGALFFIDGAQSAPHMKVDLGALGADFFAFSSHKMAGPTGVGVLWGRKELLEKLPPSRGGSGMIDRVSFEKTTYAPLPLKFEPGTPPIAEVIAFGRAIQYFEEECGGIEKIQAWEHELVRYLRQQLATLGGRIQRIGNAFPDRGPLQSFIVQGAHPLDVATLLDARGIAVRSGHLCGQPLLKTHGLTSLLRASVAYYNTKADIDYFVTALREICTTLRV